jgi:hypothetical protein
MDHRSRNDAEAEECRTKNELWIVLRDAVEDILAEKGAPLETEICFAYRMVEDIDDSTAGCWMLLLWTTESDEDDESTDDDDVTTELAWVSPLSEGGQTIIRNAVDKALSIARSKN